MATRQTVLRHDIVAEAIILFAALAAITALSLGCSRKNDLPARAGDSAAKSTVLAGDIAATADSIDETLIIAWDGVSELRPGVHYSITKEQVRKLADKTRKRGYTSRESCNTRR